MSWLVGNGSPTQAPVTRRRSWDALPPKAQSTTPVRVAKLTTELDALSARLPAPARHKPVPQVSRANSTKTATPQGHRVVTMSSGEMARAPPPPEVPPPPPTTFSSPPPPPANVKASPPEPIASPSTPVKALATAAGERRVRRIARAGGPPRAHRRAREGGAAQ